MLVPVHMAWGYVLGRVIYSVTRRNRKFNFHLMILLGGLPDYDLFLRQPYATPFGHHGVFHAWVVALLLFVPFFFRYGKESLPYFISAIQHILFGDLISNEVPLYYPLSLDQIGLLLYKLNIDLSIALEYLGYALMMALLIRQRRDTTRGSTYILLVSLPLLLVTIKQGVEFYQPAFSIASYAFLAMVSSLTMIMVLSLPLLRSLAKLS